MRSILALTVLLLALLALIGPEGGPSKEGDCSAATDEVCLGEGRLKVRVRGTTGRELGGGAAGFGFAGRDALDVVVRVEPASLVSQPATVADGSSRYSVPDSIGDRIFIGSLSRQEIWVEVTAIDQARTRVYHRPAGAGWGLVDVLPRQASEPLRVAVAP